jgi:MGT family glycosyltransferase
MNPITALARNVQERGNEVVFIGVPDAEAFARAAGLSFVPFCEDEFPRGSMSEIWGEVAKRKGIDVIAHTATNIVPRLVKPALEHLGDKLIEHGVDALVIDFTYRLLELVPIQLGMPYVQVYAILHLDFSGETPLCLFGWPHEETEEARARNREGLGRFLEYSANVRKLGKAHAEKVGLEIDWNNPAATVSRLAVISQTPREFDLPISNLPPQFYYTGPFHNDEGREPVPFPWEKLSGKPLIYASLGTLVNGLENVYRSILEAVEKFPETQVVLSVGKNISTEELGRIPANTLVVASAPQIELLKYADLCITHAGLNTALESLAQGVPMVAIPIGYDQPGVATRIAYHGAGEFVDVAEVTAERLTELIQKVMASPSYRDKARYFQKVIARTRGLEAAAQIIEQVFQEERDLVAAD